jgi:trigger factor
LKMQPAKEKIKGIRYELSFELPEQTYAEALNAELLKFQQNHAEHGFRKGHVPLSVIRSKYESAFANEVLSRLITDTLGEYLKEKGVSPAASPEVDVADFKDGQPIKFDAKFEILPEIKPLEFEKISIDRPVAKAGTKEVDEAIKNIADSRHTSEDVKDDRPAKKGDIVIIDFEGFVGGTPFDGGKGENYPLELGSGAFIPGFEDQLVGKKKDVDVDVNVAFPKDYGHAALAGKKALFKVKIHNIKEKITPAINDEFAKELKRENLDDLKKYVAELLENNYKNLSADIARARLLDVLAKEKVELPETLVERELDFMWRSTHHHAHGEKCDHDEKTIEKEKKALRSDAEKRVRLGLVVADIGRRAGVEVSENDIHQAILEEAMRRPNQAQQVFDYYKNNQTAADAIRAGIFEDKALDFALSKIKIKDKDVKPEELQKIAKELK